MTIVAGGLLGVSVLIVAASCLGVLVTPNVFDRLHFLGPASALAPVLVAIAVLLDESLSVASMKPIIVAVVLMLTGPILTHATARAARVRQFGHWVPPDNEEVPRP